ncbi:MAG TPA: ATP-binding protein [Lichenihabitans sp.]|jgi:signal transduction histidine kinase|nr:ATP-binding protein [Lichenihabitans sp.]
MSSLPSGETTENEPGAASLRRGLYGVAGLVVLLLGLLVGALLWQSWATSIRDARDRGATLAYLLAEQTTRTFQAVDLTLVGLEPSIVAGPLPDHASGFEQLLRQRVAEVDFIHALVVTDADGRVTQTSDAAIAGTLAGQSYFQALRHAPRTKMLIGRPPADRPALDGAIPVVRRLDTADGRFAGVIMASVDPRYFRDFYRNLDLGPRASIDLYQDNGRILLASTGVGTSQGVPDASPPFDLAAKLGQFRSSPSEADPQIVAYHRAQGYPLVVAVGTDIADLRSRWMRSAAPILGAASVAALLVVALAVVTERRLAERRRARNRAVTVQKLEALGQMTASVAHDFRNLLTVMQSTLTLVRKQGPREPVLQAAEAALERGKGLITQLLAFSKRHEMQVRATDINGLVSGIGSVLRHAAGPTVELDFDLAPALPECRADRTQFDAALMNLVVNARQAMPEGGTVRIATRLVAPETGSGFVALSVADGGAGIAPGDLKRIFEPFFTTKADTGTGLGLAQVHGFMRRIGGDVTVTSTPGTGTTFRLLFPVAEDGLDTVHAESEAA